MTRTPDQIYGRLPKRLPDELRFSNYALRWDGVTLQYVQVPHHVSLSPTDFSIIAWLRKRTTNRTSILRKGVLGGVQHTEYRLEADSAAGQYSFETGDGGVGLFMKDFGTRVLNRWTCIGVAWEDNARFRAYQDAVEVFNVVHAFVHVNTTAPLNIGIVEWGAGTYLLPWDDLLDELLIFPSALTADQFREIFYRGYARRELDARLVLRMEEGSGLTAYDESGYGNHGSLLPALTPPVWKPNAKYELPADARV